MTIGMEVFQAQLGYLGRGDIDGLLRDQYTDDCELVTFEFVLKGKEEIKQYLAVDSPAKMGAVLGMKITHVVATDDTIIFNGIVDSEKMGRFIARDALTLKGNRIHRHIALTLPPDVDQGQWTQALG
jgi:hypothetical protein